MEMLSNLYDKFLQPFNYDLMTFVKFMAIIVSFFILCTPLSMVVIKLLNIFTNNKGKVKESSFYRPLKVFFCLLGIFLATYLLNISDGFKFVINKFFKIICILLISKGFVNIFTNKSKFKFFKINISKQNKTLINFFDKIIILIIYIVTGFIIIYELGYNLNGLVAGLGIRKCNYSTCCSRYCKKLNSKFCLAY